MDTVPSPARKPRTSSDHGSRHLFFLSLLIDIFGFAGRLEDDRLYTWLGPGILPGLSAVARPTCGGCCL